MDSDDNYGIDTNDEIMQQLEEDTLVVYTMTMVACNTLNLFNLNELEEGGQSIVDPMWELQTCSTACARCMHCSKGLTNFKVHEFDELVSFLYPTIRDNGRSMGVETTMSGMPMKLKPEQCLFNFIMYLKHTNVNSYEFFQ